MQSLKRLYRIEKSQIGFVKFIIEAYEGVAVVSTLDAGKGVVALSIAPGCRQIIEDIMADLGRTILMEKMDEG